MRSSRRSEVGDGLLAAWWVLVALWAIASAGFVAALLIGRTLMSDTMSCSLNPETSNYGTARWSWARLGTVCEWNLGPAGTFERGPGLARWAVVVTVAGMGAALILAGNVIHRARRHSLSPPESELRSISS
jgi:hypothetical protein